MNAFHSTRNFFLKNHRKIGAVLWSIVAMETIVLIVILLQKFKPSQFLGSVIGTFIGAFLILGIERVLMWFISKKEKEQISKALDLEISDNLRLCEEIVKSLEPAHHSIFTFSEFETVWLKKFMNSCINYSDEDSIRLYSFLNGAKLLIQQFQTTHDNQQQLHTTSRALTSFSKIANAHNQKMIAIAKEIKNTLSATLELRRKEKIYFEDVNDYKSTK